MINFDYSTGKSSSHTVFNKSFDCIIIISLPQMATIFYEKQLAL
ncbi:hypothetical protein [Clostridium sp. SM-530-WT-3G]|nr:hypothetical protein [Clostridium sp. SM-530-WT-3G]